MLVNTKHWLEEALLSRVFFRLVPIISLSPVRAEANMAKCGTNSVTKKLLLRVKEILLFVQKSAYVRGKHEPLVDGHNLEENELRPCVSLERMRRSCLIVMCCHCVTVMRTCDIFLKIAAETNKVFIMRLFN